MTKKKIKKKKKKKKTKKKKTQPENSFLHQLLSVSTHRVNFMPDTAQPPARCANCLMASALLHEKTLSAASRHGSHVQFKCSSRRKSYRNLTRQAQTKPVFCVVRYPRRVTSTPSLINFKFAVLAPVNELKTSWPRSPFPPALPGPRFAAVIRRRPDSRSRTARSPAGQRVPATELEDLLYE
jgi:hypothetical protein